VCLELVIHPTAMLAFQDLPAAGPLAPVSRRRHARFFSADSWSAIVLVGGLVSVAVVWSYLYALGADRDVPHARAMALSVLLTASAGITTGLTKLRRATARWLVVGTLASLGVFVQIPALSRLLSLRPLHVADCAWLLVVFAASAVITMAVASRLNRLLD
jgi:Ca2+-transporting ATPase